MMTATDMKPIEPETLNPLSFPLSGSRLIEASAGTGKTYTIAALYVRLVLQHGGVDPNSNESLAFERALQPDELLVVTFTEAATEELRDRIRARLSEAAGYFRELRGQRETTDGFLQQLRADYPEPQWPALARRLDLAAQAMDEASVHTIHGWCNRMLREHAFASGSLFTQQLETDNQELWLLAARDYWRRFYVLQPLPIFTFLRQQFSSPEQLRSSLRVLQQHLPADLAVPDDEVFTRLQQGLAALAALKERTQPAVTELLADMPNHKGITHHLGGLQKLDEWINSAATEPNITEAGWKRFSEVELQKKFKGQLHSDWQVIWQLPQQLADLALDVQPLKQHAAAWLNQRFHMLQEQRAQMGFDDMLTRLRDALRGAHGERLAAAIREQFPVAMIDEFQDTDPIQYEIFDRIYRLHENHQQQGVFLIGDPKQAIYSFRNADIYTYLTARRATSGRHYTLRTNFRSTTAVVKAANQLFSLAERSPESYPQGPFRFRRGDEDEVPFLPVTANGLKTAAQVLDEPLPGLAIKVSAAEQGGEVKKETLEQELAEACADDMVRLLTHATLVEGDTSQSVSPGQLAVLVNNAREAQLIRNALRQRQVASVYLSDRDSVFAGAIATDMLLLLQSCADPRDPGKLRAALATSVLQFSLATLHQVVEDETLWDNYAAQFIAYHQVWLKRGVLAMLQRILHDFEVPKRLLQSHAGQAGERLLTDILHLAELLQQQAQHADGMSGLVRFLAEHIEQVREQGNRTDSTEQQVRLESDSELVQVVTIHKSKGLQYPFVFLPFVSVQKAAQHRLNYPAVYHSDAGEIQLALSSADKEGSARADDERLAEDIRKFYVAVTRAQYSTFIYAAKFKEFGETALNYLLSGSREAVGELTSAMTNAWASTELKVERIVPAVDKTGGALMYQPQLPAVPEWQYCRVPAEHRLERWWLSSYSSLALASADEMQARREGAEESADQQNSLEELNEQARMVSTWAEPKQQSSSTPLHSFPKGPQPGTFLHNLLEAAAAEGFAELANNPQKVAAVVSAYTQLAPWQEYHDLLCDWLTDYLNTRFMLGNPESEQDAVCLADLVTYQAEPEFWFATHQTSVAKLDELIQTYILPAENTGKQSSPNRPALQATTLNGMMKGFIDLVFEWQGRYYVADYKSNWLGTHEEDYTEAAMRQKILASRYDVQYVIYTLALHKLLKARLGEAYSYETHVGGALYLFLRGYKATTAGAFFDRPPYALIEQLEALLG